ncbi:MAG: cytochrome c oxidase subunit II [Streptosporangiales bacterium]|nr:cytochrome c oxidase subunit II [Streptosporangiales bacterium]
MSLLALIVLTACSRAEVERFGMPVPATEEAKRILSLWQGSWIAALAVGVLVWGLIIWAAIFHRKKHDRLPPQVRENSPIEALFTITPLIMVAVLFFFTARDEAVLIDTSKPADVTVDVVAYQWSWKFYYEDDGINGRDLEDGITVVGRAGEKPTLVIPEGRRVQFNLYSQDVIHSFWIPAFLFKQDANPYKQPPDGKEFWQMGKEDKPNWNTKFQIQPNRQGTFAGRCAELCGTDHSKMLFTVKVVSWSEYQQYVDDQKSAQASAQGGAGS